MLYVIWFLYKLNYYVNETIAKKEDSNKKETKNSFTIKIQVRNHKKN